MHKLDLDLDTTKRYCVIRVCYVPETVRPGESYHIGSFSVTDKPFYECTQPIAIINLTEHGDYVGGDVEASNYRVLAADKTIAPHLIHLYGSHGYKGLAYQAYTGPFPPCEELTDALESLQDHCLLDENDHSTLEMELEHAAWESDGREDFAKALVAMFDSDIDSEHEHELEGDDVGSADLLDELWRDGCDAFNVNGGTGFKIETGCLVYFYIDEWCRVAKRDPRARVGAASTKLDVRGRIRKLAEECRTVDGV